MRKISRKGLIKKNWEICRLIKFSLVGRKCELCDSEYGLQVDHCFSRRIKELFYCISNLTVLCESCHTKKSYFQKDTMLSVFELVEDREGITVFGQLRATANKMGSFKEWNTISYHEDMNEKLSRQLAGVA